MVEEVRGYLSDMIDAIATKRYDDLQQITEFAPAAKHCTFRELFVH